MKKEKLFGLFAGALMLVSVTGCDLMGTKDTVKAPSAPDMGSPSAIPTSGGTVPDTADNAKALFSEAVFNLNTVDLSSTSSSNNTSKVLSRQIQSAARNVSRNLLPRETQTTPINEVLTIGGGTITLSGSITETITSSSSTTNNLVHNVSNVSINQNLTSTINNVTLPETGSPTYTYNGKTINNFQVKEIMDITTDNDRNIVSMDMDLSIAVQAGFAISVKRNSDGVGAKFILSYDFNYSKNNIDFLSTTVDFSDLQAALESKQATLKVYDDNNNLKYSITLTLAELNMIDPSEFVSAN